MEPKILLPP